MGGLFRARGRQTWDDPVMHRENYQSKCQSDFKSPNISLVCLFPNTCVEGCFTVWLSRSCMYSHLPAIHHPSKYILVFWTFPPFQPCSTIKKTSSEKPNSATICVFVIPPRDPTATVTDGLINVCILQLVMTNQSWNRGALYYAIAAHECIYLVHTRR